MNSSRPLEIILFFSLSVLTAGISSAGATTYYIRPDGGNPEQCSGTQNSPYPGNGVNKACAYAHPFYLLDTAGAWTIQGGDTILIARGSYKMGYGAPNTSTWCEQTWSYACHLPALPSGTAGNCTRLLGQGWDSG